MTVIERSRQEAGVPIAAAALQGCRISFRQTHPSPQSSIIPWFDRASGSWNVWKSSKTPQ